MAYDILKFLHVLGVIILVGNVTITAFWKVFADRTEDAKVVAFGQYLVILCDWIFTLAGIVLIVIGGYGLAITDAWLIWGQVLFVVSGLIWLFLLVPLQIRQARHIRAFNMSEPVPEEYWRDARLWLIWGIIATVPLVGADYVMIAKPL
jgi:uncharacterized membrane protein